MYQHGIYVSENPTSITQPISADSAVQVIVGIAPVNLLADPASAVNKPILVKSFSEAKEKMGYSDDFTKFSICQSVDASFNIYHVAPLVLINVLDPATHKVAVAAEVHSITTGKVTIQEEGILLDNSFIVKSANGVTTYDITDDYTVAFNDDGHVVVTRVTTGAIPAEATQLSFSYNQLDPTAVTENDVIGAYTAATNSYTGLQVTKQVFPQLGIVPGLILAPGYSHKPNIKTAMTSLCEGLNGLFKCNAVVDIDTTAADTYGEAITWKSTNLYTDKHHIVCWPMVKISGKTYYKSALVAALIAYTDAPNKNVPFVSPSNKSLKISAAVLASGAEVYLDFDQANELNGAGIVTALNFNGWRLWGNNTGAYPDSVDPKDRFIPVRRMFDWWGNSFILTYFNKVDDPLNIRLIESVVDTENIKANGFKARFQIADAKIVFDPAENPTTDIVGGKIKFRQYLAAFTPAEVITNILEFDPNALSAALGGGE